MMSRSVDLPQPLGPRRQTNSPSSTVSHTFSNASTVARFDSPEATPGFTRYGDGQIYEWQEADDRLGRQVASGPGVPVRLHLPPHPADHVLADRSAEKRAKRPADPA